jgi:tryptophan synthase alpha chain
VTTLLDALRVSLQGGRKLLVPYLMGGIPDRVSFPDAMHALNASADAVEVGLPFSDPLMDGPVIAAAGERVISAGLGPLDVLDLCGELPTSKPRVCMTYYNPIHRTGETEFCRKLAAAGFAGLIVPDLPIEESQKLMSAVAEAELAWIPLVAPSSPPERVARIVAGATGFVYAVSTLGVTGRRDELAAAAAEVVDRCRVATDLPILVGIGISTAEQAVEAARFADGVVIGTAVVAKVLEEGAEVAGAWLGEIRAALDA